MKHLVITVNEISINKTRNKLAQSKKKLKKRSCH